MIDIFYMHLPKTGGSTIELYFKSIYGDSFLSHCEHLLDKGRKDEIDQYQVVSGHVPYRKIRNAGIEYKTLLTSIRHPFDQLVSHIRWVYFIGQDINHQRFKSHSPPVQRIAKDLNSIDYSNKDQVLSYFDRCNENLHLFDNMMTRYFTGIRVRSAIEEKHLLSAISTSVEFDEIINLDNLHGDMQSFLESKEVWQPLDEMHANKNGAKLSGSELNELSDILLPRYAYDLELYEALLVR